MKPHLPVTLVAALPALVLAAPASAHVDPATHGSLAAGLTHPMLGADHLLAMLSVGLWAAVLGGRALLAMPATFVGAMIAGFGLAMAGVGLPFVEPAILASVVALGVLVALAVRLPLGAGLSVVAAFALFHGQAHGAEIGGATAAGYVTGFAVSTALLHAAGIGLGLGLARLGRAWTTRGAGGAVALAGAALAFAG